MRKKKSFRTAAVVLAIAAAVSGIPVAAAEDENTSDASSANASNCTKSLARRLVLSTCFHY
ncbi:MAG: hypothetical protein Q4B00_07580, partial [Eubacteriales bacterium]|nr:hypothetical protein [Eubacteriales bacterium]